MNIKTLMMTFSMALSLLAGPTMAGPLEDGVVAFKGLKYSSAFKIWQPVAEQGDAHAQDRLAFLYFKGYGVSQDYAKAIKYFRLAADQDLASARFYLGVMYANGLGVGRDDGEAVNWYRQAANQGDIFAQGNLGAMYNQGLGVPPDFVQAQMWFTLAALGFPAAETKYRDGAVGNHDNIAAKMTPGQIAEAQRLAQEWLAVHPKK